MIREMLSRTRLDKIKRPSRRAGAALFGLLLISAAVVVYGFKCTRSGPVQDAQVIYVYPPQNLTGNEALTRGLEGFDRVIQDKISQTSHSLYSLLDAFPRGDQLGDAKIRLSGPRALFASGAPMEHALFEWIKPDASERKMKPSRIRVVEIRGEPLSGTTPYRIRFVGVPKDASKSAQASTEPGLGQIAVEVSSDRDTDSYTCRFTKSVSDLIPRDNQVALEPVLEGVAACILGDHFRHANAEEVPAMFGLLFDRRTGDETARMISSIQGIKRYTYFAEQWESRPEEAFQALGEALRFFQEALETKSGRPESIDPASYPIIGYLFAHALTSAIVGPTGSNKPSGGGDRGTRNDYKETLGRHMQTIFGSAPFNQAKTTMALAFEALGDMKEAARTWNDVVASLPEQSADNEKDKKKEGANEEEKRALEAQLSRRRITARIHLLLSYRALSEEENARKVGEEIDRDLGKLYRLSGGADTGSASHGLDVDMAKATFELDMAVDCLRTFLEATSAAEKLRVGPSILSTSAAAEIKALLAKNDRNDPDLCDKNGRMDDDTRMHDPAALASRSEQCKREPGSCEGFREWSVTHMKYIGHRYLGAALLKLSRASDLIERHPPGQGGNAEMQSSVRAKDELAANVAVMARIFRCYSPKFQPVECPNSAAAASVVPGAERTSTESSVTTSSAMESSVTTTNSTSSGSVQDERWQRWLQRSSLRPQIIESEKFCGERDVLASKKRSVQLLKELRNEAIPEVWLEDPPTPSELLVADERIRSVLGSEAYKKELPSLRALHAYAQTWKVALPVASMFRRLEPPSGSSELCASGVCNEKEVRSKIEEVGRQILMPVDEKMVPREVEILADLGGALKSIGDGEPASADRKARIERLVSCRGAKTDAVPTSCALGAALASHEHWAKSVQLGGSIEPARARALYEESRQRAGHLRSEMLQIAGMAYREVVADFFQWIERATSGSDESSIRVRIMRIAFFRVLLVGDAPTFYNDAVGVLGLRLFRAMTAVNSDMRGLQESARPTEAIATARAVGFTRPGEAGRTRLIQSELDLEMNTTVASMETDVFWGACSSLGARRQFLGYFREAQDQMQLSWLDDPHLDTALDFNDNLRRWCDHRGVSTLGEVSALQSLVRSDLQARDAMAGTPRKESGRLAAVARFVASDDFPRYAFARYEHENGEPEKVEQILQGIDQLDARMLRARALLASGQAARAMVSAASAVREYEAIDALERFTFEGSLYSALGDAALRVAILGGIPADNDRDSKQPSPPAEYYLAIDAYKKAIERADSEALEGGKGGLNLRLSSCYIETYSDDLALKEAVSQSGSGFGCEKGIMLSSLAQWGRGDHDMARRLSAFDGSASLFDLEQASDSIACPSDRAPVPLGSRAKWIRKQLLRDRPTVASAQP